MTMKAILGTVMVALLWAGVVEGQGGAVANVDAVQRFVLNPGWNLVTFQVLPENRGVADVFASVVTADNSRRPLFDPGVPEGSLLQAAFALDGVEERDGSETRFRWRALPSARYSDLAELPPGFPFPELLLPSDESGLAPAGERRPFPSLADGQIHEADGVLNEVRIGAGYLLLVSGIQRRAVFEIGGTELADVVPVVLETGWNLIGFPFDVTVEDEPRLITSLFPVDYLDQIERIAAWDSDEAEYRSYVPSRPEDSLLRRVRPASAYWIRSLDAVEVRPRLVVAAPADEDQAPLQVPAAEVGANWVPGPEDVETSPRGVRAVFDSAASQAWIRIPAYDVTLRLPLYNAGVGVVGWMAEVSPYSGHPIEGTVALDNSEAANNVFTLAARRGVVSNDPGTIEIGVNRARLVPATYLADLEVRSSVGDERRFTLAVEVGGLNGQWAGFVTIETVNGRRNAVPDIDVHLHVSADGLDGSRLLRGFIDSRETLLWPVDAPLLGQMLEPRLSPGWRRDYRTRFVLEGDVTLPPADRNRFPFDRFPETTVEWERCVTAADSASPCGPQPDGPETCECVDPDTGLVYLTNREGDRRYYTLAGRRDRADLMNPNQSFVSRHYQFLGAATDSDDDFHPLATIPESQDDSLVTLRGRYVETITGLLPEPIRMEGRFRLQKVSGVPYEMRPLRAFRDVSVSTARLAGETVTTEIEVREEDDLLVHRAMVVVRQNAADDMHRLAVTTPHGQTIVLHRGENVGPADRVVFDSSGDPVDKVRLLNPPSTYGFGQLRRQTGESGFAREVRNEAGAYVVRRPRESLAVVHNRRAAGTWQLSWTHFNENRQAELNGWALLLFGPPITRVEGKVVIAAGAGPAEDFDDVELDVVGPPVFLDRHLMNFDPETGRFSLDYLPPVRLNVLASKPGYVQAGIAQLDEANHPRGFRDGLEGFHAGGPGADRLTILLEPQGTAAAAGAVGSTPVGSTMGGEGARYRFAQGAAVTSYAVPRDGETEGPVLHAVVGGQLGNLDVAATDGEYRLSAGAVPGLDP